MKREDNVQINWNLRKHHDAGNLYQVSIQIPMNVGWIDDVSLMLEDGHGTNQYPMHFVKNENGKAQFVCDLFLCTKAVYPYYFQYKVRGQKYFVTNRETKTDLAYDEKNKISVNFEVPEWAKGGVMYHIFVDRFHRSPTTQKEPMPRRQLHEKWMEKVVLGDNPNISKHYAGEEVWNVDFFGGDIKGIEEKLDYLESLGVTIIYLSPIVESQSTHRYDATNYHKIDPYAGTDEDLKRLCDAAHKRGMRVILDAVFNHVGDESIYFDRFGEHKTGNPHEDGAFNNPESKYQDFFRHTDSGGYKYWWNFLNLPVLNCDTPIWRETICGEGGVIDYWFSLGIDGLRLDVADDLSDPALEDIHKAVVRNKKDGFILGEVWDDAVRTGRTYINSGRSMHSYMNYQLTDALVRYVKYQDANRLNYALRDIQAYHPDGCIQTAMNFTSTHDISRIITLLGKKKFDTYHRFRQLDGDLQNIILDSFLDLGFSNEKVCDVLEGRQEISFDSYYQFMQKLREKGVPEETVSYLMSIFSHTPFNPDKDSSGKGWAKNIHKSLEKNLAYTQAYRLTPEEYKQAKELYKTYLLFLTMYPGILSIFYGDETGLEGLNNLDNRKPFPWGREDPEILSTVRSMGMFRKNHPDLRDADFRLLSVTPDVVTTGRYGDSDYLTIINNSDYARRVEIPREFKDKERVLTLKKENGNLLAPHSGIVIQK